MFINEAAMKTEYWGTIPYREAWSRQQELFDKLVHQRGSGETCENRLIFCEHPHVYTLGRHGKEANMLLREEQLKQIFQQKYFIYFLQNPWDGYYENRRVGYPILPINPNTNMNQVATQLPKRWTYPQKEYNENKDNLQEALDRQFNGKDLNNDLMWILKN